jgi:hypothetical protein
MSEKQKVEGRASSRPVSEGAATVPLQEFPG